MVDSQQTQWLTTQVIGILEEVSGHEIPADAGASSFFDLGLDSLILTQAAQALSKRFGVPLKLRHLAQEHPTADGLTEYLAPLVKPSVFPAAAAASAPAVQAAPAAAAAPVLVAAPQAVALPRPSLSAAPLALGSGSSLPGSAVEQLIREQLAVMSRQLELLAVADMSAVSSVAVTSEVAAPAPAIVEAPAASVAPSSAPASAVVAKEAPAAPVKGHGPQLVIHKTSAVVLTPTQEKHLAKFTERYCSKTAKSKAFTTRNRAGVADPRTVAGFKPSMKELVYPIVVDRSSGCHLWDLDGTQYVDLLSGYGSNFFGFGAPFVKEAIAAQLDRGMEIGPQTHLVEEVGDLFRELTGAERVAFCNTGSEAVLAALRMARTTTGRDLVVMFTGGYHGIFDEVVVRPGKAKSMPAAPGIPGSATENILVLPWAQEEALAVIRERIDEIAAVLVEPVQSRAPEVQPVEFLKELRRITSESGAALIFDEVVCGFRVAPGGAQEYFGIKADLASYGKVVGGGLSIGFVGGRREFMDSLDGGQWQFGDDSIPEVGVTYFAGTFVRHPVHMAAARAVLLHLKAEGAALQARVNDKTTKFTERMNALFERTQAPLKMYSFSSVMKFATTSDVPYGELLFAHLRERGVHVWDGRPSFLTDAHTEEDLAKVEAAFASAIAEMQEAEFYPKPIRQLRADMPPEAGARLGRDPSGKPTWYVSDASSPSGYRAVASAE